jgi:AraC-like DNA-binding protein/mannose-6-phosphate isomerase-like protein (cupin superfamily)
MEPQPESQRVHVWPFFPEFPIDVRFLKFGRKRGIRSHRHDYFELLYLHSGELDYEVQDRRFPMKQGDLLVIGGAQFHRICSYGRTPVKAAVLAFLPEIIRGTERTRDDIEYLMPFLMKDDGRPVIPGGTGIPSEVFDLMQRASAELPANSFRGRLSVKTYLKMILVLLLNHYTASGGCEDVCLRQQREFERLVPLFEFIDHNYSGAISVEQAAVVARMSKSAFMRLFKQVTGQPFVAYLNHFRIAKAEALLVATRKTIAEVSQEVGFCDQSYFGLVFRSVTKVSPRDYKNRAEKTAVEARY